MLDDAFKEELINDFILESREHLETVEPDLLKIEAQDSDGSRELINEVFRAIHSLKSSAGFFGFEKMKELAHAMENLLMMIRDDRIELLPEYVDVLIRGNDKLRLMLDDLTRAEQVDVTTEINILKKSINQKTAKSQNAKSSAGKNISGSSGRPLDERAVPAPVTMEQAKKLKKQGHKFYRLVYTFEKHIHQRQEKFNEIRDLLASIGTILYCDQDRERLSHDMMSDDAEIEVNVWLATILQKDYLIEGLDLKTGQVQELDLEELEVSPANRHHDKKIPNSENNKSRVAEKTTDDDEKLPAADTYDRNSTTTTLRVPVRILNSLIDLAGELVLNRNQLKQLVATDQPAHESLSRIVQNIDIITSDLQGMIMNARLQPVGVIMNKFPRLIRDLSRKLNKEIDLAISGKDVEMDKTIIESLADPLAHLVRNCADHGIETPDERLRHRKPRRGKIILKAYHKNGMVNIGVIDDGRGIDPDVIRQRARSRNLIPSDQLENLNDREIINLTMKPGFSTSEDITEVSGRGVGLDVVKTNIEKLGGTVEISSVVGRSTAITVKLPLTLAIIPAQIIEAAGNRYAVPQVNLEEIVVAGGEKNKYHIENIDGKELLDLRGEFLPLLDLNRLLKIETNHESQGGSDRDCPGEAKPAKTGPETRRNILILNTGTNRFGLGVTEFLDSEEIVVKPLSAYIKRCRFYSGATILGDGQVAMILDVAGLAEEGRLDFRRSSAAGPTGEEVIEIEQTDTAGQFLMFENAPNEYFALPLALITRIDRIKRVDLKTIDGRIFYNSRDRLQRIIFLHDYLKASPTDTDDEFIYAILPRLVPHPIAVGAARLNDIITTGTDLNFADHTEPGIIGSAIIDKKPTVFLDLFGLLEKAAPELYNPEFNFIRMNPGQILLVESNPIFMIMLENYLSAPGIDPITAATGSEALEAIQEHNPDLVLTSLRPSLLDIESLIRQARELPGGERITLIGLTEHRDDFNTRATLRKQFADEVLKFDKYSLLSKLATDAPITRPEVR